LYQESRINADPDPGFATPPLSKKKLWILTRFKNISGSRKAKSVEDPYSFGLKNVFNTLVTKIILPPILLKISRSVHNGEQ
jgi:hypothetical protein